MLRLKQIQSLIGNNIVHGITIGTSRKDETKKCELLYDAHKTNICFGIPFQSYDIKINLISLIELSEYDLHTLCIKSKNYENMRASNFEEILKHLNEEYDLGIKTKNAQMPKV